MLCGTKGSWGESTEDLKGKLEKSCPRSMTNERRRGLQVMHGEVKLRLKASMISRHV